MSLFQFVHKMAPTDIAHSIPLRLSFLFKIWFVESYVDVLCYATFYSILSVYLTFVVLNSLLLFSVELEWPKTNFHLCIYYE